MSSGESRGGASSPTGSGHSLTPLEGDEEEEEEEEREEGEEEEEEDSTDSVSGCLLLLCIWHLFISGVKQVCNHTIYTSVADRGVFYTDECHYVPAVFQLYKDDSILAEWVPTRTSSHSAISSVKVSLLFIIQWEWVVPQQLYSVNSVAVVSCTVR